MITEEYIKAAVVSCPKCKAAAGSPCQEGYCKNGRKNCDYAICYRLRDRKEPHLERAVKAYKESNG